MPLDLAQAARFLERELPQAGFAVNLVRTKPARELLALYSVTGFTGKVWVRTLSACQGAGWFSVSARPEVLGKSLHAQ